MEGQRATNWLSTAALIGEAQQVASGYHTNYVVQRQNADGATPFATTAPSGITPAQIRRAYGFDQITFGAGTIPADGAGTTIAIVSAFDNPNIENDLRQFSLRFGLPDPPLFTKVNQTGGSDMPSTNGIWARETALDVQWAHAIAPKANILLVQANNNSITNLNAAVAYAARQQGVSVVSMSFGGGEFAAELANDSIFLTPAGHQGVTFVAASGDFGAPPSQPAISPNVVAVGGTTLTLDGVGNIISESGWTGSGGGISAYQPQPSYQTGVVTQSTTMRTNPDVAYNASPSTGFPIYDTFNNPISTPWSQIGGTSAAAPQWAGLVAIANQGRALAGLGSLDSRNETLPTLYSLTATDFFDTSTGGSNGAPNYEAATGYDLVTGRGSPRADRIVANLIGQGVSFTAPAVGAVVSSAPASHVIHFSSAADPASVQASDLTVNGVAASSVSLSANGKTATFTFTANPVTAQGPQTMRIAAGAIHSQGTPTTPFIEFTGKYFFDSTPLQITSTNPPPGGTFTLPGPLTIDVNFNEVVDPLSVQTTDLVLVGRTVTNVSVVNNGLTARFTFNGTNEGPLTAHIASGAVTDGFGNPNANTFTTTYILDSLSTPLPTPLAPRLPLGSLVYETSAFASITSSDTDTYTLALDAGQTLTVLVRAVSPALQPTVEIRDPANIVVASLAAAASGKHALVQAVPAAASGIYTITVRGGSSTVGSYVVQVSLNSVLEIEQELGEPANDTRATAQTLSLVPVDSPTGIAQRMTVLGGNAPGAPAPATEFDFESGTNGFVMDNTPGPGSATGLWHRSQGRGTQPGHSATHSFYYGQGEGQSGGGTYETIAPGIGSQRNKGSLTSPPIPIPPGAKLNFNYLLRTEQFALSDTATVLVSTDGFATSTLIASNTTNLAERSTWGPTAPIDLAAYVNQTVQFRWIFDTVDEIHNGHEGWYIDDVQVTLPSIWNDYFAITLAAGESITAALKLVTGSGANVALEDLNGAVLATGVAGATNLDRAISNFRVTSGGTYFLRVTGNLAATYSLVTAKNTAFDTEGNETFATAQPITGVQGALGAIAAGDLGPDWYVFDVSSTAHRVRLQTATRADGINQFINILNPRLELYSPTGELIITGTPQADGRNELIEFQPIVTGAYRVRVTTENGTTGEYSLTKTFAPVASSLTVTSPTTENESATVIGTIIDPDVLEPHTVIVNWGPGEGTSTINLAPGVTTFSATHPYLDDDPTATATDAYPIGISVTDNHGASGTGSTSVTVSNVAPAITSLTPAAQIDENGSYTVIGTFRDAGTRDKHTVVIGWGGTGQPGEGTTTITANGPNPPGATLVQLETGEWHFTASHLYLDDNPSTSLFDEFQVAVNIADDDGGNTTSSAALRVNNLAPALFSLSATPLVENGTTTLTGAISDTGTLDTFTIVIDWGNGTQTINNVPSGVFSYTRQYLDDGATGIFPISVNVADDDGASVTATASAVVTNAAPTVSLGPLAAVAEGSKAQLSGVIVDPGALDTFELTIDWGDPLSPNNVESIDLANPPAHATWNAGTRNFTIAHTYVDDHQSGTANDQFAINVVVKDDDDGTNSAGVSITVNNTPPEPSLANVSTPQEEGKAIVIEGAATDAAGARDTLSYAWSVFKNASATPFVTGGNVTTFSFTPDNDGSYRIELTALDEDGGSSVFRQTVTVANLAPFSTGQDVATNEDSALPLTLSATDVPGDVLSFAILTQPLHGAVSGSAPNLTYTPTGDYHGPDSFSYRSSDGQLSSTSAVISINVRSVNDAPEVDDSSFEIAEDLPLASASGALLAKAGDVENDDLAAQLVDNAAHGDVTVHPNGTFSYTPASNYNGPDSFTYRVNDGQATSQVAVAVINVTPLNDLPGFTSSGDLDSTDESGPETIAAWAGNVKAGPNDELSQLLSFVVTTDNDGLFLVPPKVNLAGTLTFTPQPNARGSAKVTVKLIDDGGPAQGGIEPSVTQVFTIDVAKPHPWYNAARAFDVDGNGQVAPIDALAIINYLNSLPPGAPSAVSPTAATGQPFGFLDTNAGNDVAPFDALLIINDLNASRATGEGEGTAALETPSVNLPAARGFEADLALADIIFMLAHDVAEHGKRRRSAR